MRRYASIRRQWRRRLSRLFGLPRCCLAMLLLAMPLISAAATFTVDYADDVSDDDPGDGVCDIGVNGLCTLRAALEEARTTFEPDIIEIEGGLGPITLFVDRPLTIDRALTIRGLGETPSTIQPGPSFDQFWMIEAIGVVVKLENLEITGHASAVGYAISGVRTRLEIVDCFIHDNAGTGISMDFADGSALYSFAVRNSVISDNGGRGVRIAANTLSSPQQGLIEGTLIDSNLDTGLTFEAGISGSIIEVEVLNSTISNNSDGGMFLSRGWTKIRNSVISGNGTTDVRGGGGIWTDSYTWVIDSMVTGNSAVRTAGGGGGGGIRSEDNVIAIFGSTISDNQADIGGGVDIRNPGASMPAQIINSTISGNRATLNGGGIFSQVDLDVQCSTIAFNQADSNTDDSGDGGGIYASTDEVRLHNSILGDNVARSGTIFPIAPDCTFAPGAAVISDGYNMVSRTRDCGLVRLDSDVFGVGEQHGLQPLADNGGPTLTHALAAPSLALDAGDPQGCTWNDDLNPATDPIAVIGDQRGYSRPADGGGGLIPDMGAFELNGVLPEVIFGDGFE